MSKLKLIFCQNSKFQSNSLKTMSHQSTTNHPTLKFGQQLKKSSNPGLSLASLVQASTVDGASAVVASADDAEDSLTFALDTKMVIDDIEWEF